MTASLPLVTPGWLHSRLQDANLRILDGTWYMPNAGGHACHMGSHRCACLHARSPQEPVICLDCAQRVKKGSAGVHGASGGQLAGKNPKEEFRASRIPGSRFFDMDRVSDPSTDLPHMLPSEGAFAAAADALGVTRDTQAWAHAHACATILFCSLKTYVAHALIKVMEPQHRCRVFLC